VVAGEGGVQGCGVDLTVGAELVGGGAEPAAGGFPGPGVVVLDALAD
jgi:hypothetical protein